MPVIRSARPGDVAEVVALWDRAGGPTRHAGRDVETTRLLERDPDALLVAALDGWIVGTVIVGWDGWRCHLYRLAVAPEHRRLGIAGALVAAAQQRAHQLGAVRLDAMVDDENASAIGFWATVGFEAQGNDSRWSLVL